MDSGRVTLALGRMPRNALPATHWAAGPWCFAGQEDVFPQWDTAFVFAPEPLADRMLQARACAEAKGLAAYVLPRMAQRLCDHASDLPSAYWETLLLPPVIAVARQIVERWWRVRSLVQAWGKERLHVALLPTDCVMGFATGQDFVLYGALGHDWNHWLLSRLLETVFPPAWSKEYLPPVVREYARPVSALGRVRALVRNMTLRLPFPPLKGMSCTQALRYSLALMHRSRGADMSTPLQAHAADVGLPLETLPIFLWALPHDVAALRHPAKLRRDPLGPRVRVASVCAYEDAAYRQELAIWRGRGNRLMFVQHGGNYGQARIVCDSDLVEYSQHAFGTWGWTRHGQCRGNFLPVPYPQLAKARDTQSVRRTADALLFLGAEMPTFGYRLESLPTPLQNLDYRRDKARFLAALPAELLHKSVYRPYFPVPGTLQDAEWLLRRFPQVGRADGPLDRHLAQCRLLILDHNGTTLLEAMAANRPVLAFWRREHWPLVEEGEMLLDILARAGIWLPEPSLAAAKASEVWEHPWQWWASDEVQQARRTYCASQAMLVPGSPDPYWVQLLRRL